MALTYQQLLHDTAIRLNALVGTQAAALATTYDTGNLTAANFKSADWPFNSFRDAILMAEAEFVWAIADVGDHPWRSNFTSTLTGLTNPSNIPATDGSSKKIVGVLGGVYDTADGNSLREAPRELVLRINRMATGIPEYLYFVDGRRIVHTRTSVIIEVCVYDLATQLTAFGANGNSILPDNLRAAVSCRAASNMQKTTLTRNQDVLKTYREYSDQALATIRAGLTSVNPKSIPLEDLPT